MGRNRDPKPLSTGIYADDILEKAQESLEDEWCCEWSIFRPSEEQVADLQVELQKAMDAWFEKHELQPKWFVVDDVESIFVENTTEGD